MLIVLSQVEKCQGRTFSYSIQYIPSINITIKYLFYHKYGY